MAKKSEVRAQSPYSTAIDRLVACYHLGRKHENVPEMEADVFIALRDVADVIDSFEDRLDRANALTDAAEHTVQQQKARADYAEARLGDVLLLTERHTLAQVTNTPDPKLRAFCRRLIATLTEIACATDA